MKTDIPRLLIAGVSSGVGKTTTMLALARALQKRGLKVVSFKCGPDYLDPTYHQRNLGIPCHNLDGWMMGREAVLRTFAHASAGADIALIEGVMGLFDGAEPNSQVGSSAEIAKWLSAPVILVADVSGMAGTIDAVASGFANYDPELNVAGLIANRAGSASHLSLIKRACRSLPMLGGLPKQKELQFPERHLGLVAALHNGSIDANLEAWAKVAEENITWEHLMATAKAAPGVEVPEVKAIEKAKACTIAYAFDEAFHFYYDDNLNLLRQQGAKLVPFSPLKDEGPGDCQGIYIGGGYPELYADQLEKNTQTKKALLDAAAKGIPIYAECGGYMYLSEGIRTLDGKTHAMVGLLPGILQMHPKLQSLGYAEVEVLSDSILGEAGTRFRGHEFRYSTYESGQDESRAIYKVRKRRNQDIRREGYQSASVLGSYIHAHWASNPAIPRHFIASCQRTQACND